MRRHKKFDSHTHSMLTHSCCFMKDTIFIRSDNHSVGSSSYGCCSGVLPSLSVSSQLNFVRRVSCLRRESLSAEFGVRHWMKRNLSCNETDKRWGPRRTRILKRRESGKPERLASRSDKAIYVDIVSAARAWMECPLIMQIQSVAP